MAKQPKYFISNNKPLKPSPASSVPSLPTTPQGSEPTTSPLHTEHRSLGRHVPKLILTAGLFTLTGLSLLVGVSTGVVNAALFRRSLPSVFPQATQTGVSIGSPGSAAGQGLNVDIQVADARVEIVRSFLERHKSPLTPHEKYAQELVKAADRYGLDYRLLPAIMMQESNLCKASDPKLHNCLGFGIHSRGTLGFDSYEEGFDRAARELRENYIDQGLTTPSQIMRKYTPSSNGSWEASVNQWIAEMEHNDREIGKTASADADLLEYTTKR